MLYYLFSLINIEQLSQIFLDGNIKWIIVALMFQLTSTYLASYRWFKVSKLIDFKERFSFFIKSYFKGTFFNQVLPSSIGGDAVRILDLIQKKYTKTNSFYSVTIDRVIGLVGLLALNLIATLMFYGTFDQNFSLLIISIAIFGIFGFLSLFYLEKIKFLSKYKFLQLFHKLAIRLNQTYPKKSILFKHIFISIGVHFLSILTVYTLSISIDLGLSFKVLLIALPPVFLMTIIPLSLAGWGIREGAMVGIFLLVGADQTKILALSILYGILLIISSIPGSYFWVSNSSKEVTKG